MEFFHDEYAPLNKRKAIEKMMPKRKQQRKQKSLYPDYRLMREELIAGQNADLFYIGKADYAFILSIGICLDQLDAGQRSRLMEIYEKYISTTGDNQ